jgi:uncharacterized membrane protein (UPF0127 family)
MASPGVERRWARTVSALVLIVGVSCQGAADAEPNVAPPSTPRIPVTIATEAGDVTFQAELADDDAERQKGLMFRTAMGDSEGMLFLFPREQQLAFWMRNTLIPLDMVFIKADRTILGVVENATPRTETSRKVPGNSQFVLELNGGTASRLGIKAGQAVTFLAPTPRS